MFYNRPYARARWGTLAKDYEIGVDYDRLRKERFAKAQAAVKAAVWGQSYVSIWRIFDISRVPILGSVQGLYGTLLYLSQRRQPFLFDPAVPAKRISCPWMEDRMEAPISIYRGALPPETKIQDKFAQQVKRVLSDYGVEKMPIGIDYAELPMWRALEKAGINLVDGQQAMLEAREIKTVDELELMKTACAMTEAVHEAIARTIRPGVKESDIVALAAQKYYQFGANRVPLIQAVTGPRGIPIPIPLQIALFNQEILFTLILLSVGWVTSTVTIVALLVESRTSIRRRPMKKPRNGSII